MSEKSKFDCLDLNTNIFDQIVLEASAGTGKTFAIEHVFLRLLIEEQENEPLNIEEILVVTFTKKAAKELKLRIRSNIERTLSNLKHYRIDPAKDISFPSYILFHLQSKELLNKALDRLEEALTFFEQSQIFTIHSFCYRMLKEFAFDASFRLSIKEEENEDEIIKNHILDYLNYKIEPDRFAPEQILLLRKRFLTFDDLFSSFFKALKARPKIIEDNSFSLLYKKFLQEINNFKERFLIDKLMEDFFNLLPCYNKSKIKLTSMELQKQAELLFQVVVSNECCKETFAKFLKAKHFFIEYFQEENKNKKIKEFPKLNYPTFFSEAEEKLLPILKNGVDTDYLFNAITADIQKEIKKTLEEEEIFSFDDILLKMQQALENSDFKIKVQEKFSAFIIDEFQDTDPVQWQIFQTLFVDTKKLRALYLIGDPKQSIYSFRNSDLYTYIEAVKKIGKVAYLDNNYRSVNSLIDSLNALFGNKSSFSWLNLPRLKQDLPYLPIRAPLKKETFLQDDKKGVHFFIQEAKGSSRSFPSQEMESRYFSFMVNEILKLTEKFNLKLEQFAILVKDRYQEERLQKFLKEIQMPFISKRRSNQRLILALQALKQLIDAVLHPRDLNKIKIALGTTLIGFDLNSLLNLSSNEKILKQFFLLREVLQEKGLPLFFQVLLKTSFDEKNTLLEEILEQKNSYLYHDLMQCIELLLAKESEQKGSMEFLLETIDKIKEEIENEESLASPMFDEGGVLISTLHMSKGLEYDIVFAYGLINRVDQDDEESIEELQAEKLRLFYVALTRAKYRVYVPIALDENEKPLLQTKLSAIELFLSFLLDDKEQIKKSKLLEKFESLKQEGHISFEFINMEYVSKTYQLRQDMPHLSQEKMSLCSFEEKNIYSYSSIAAHKSEGVEVLEDTLPVGAQTGIIIHSIFENICKAKSFDEKIIKGIIEAHVKNSNLAPWSKAIEEMVESAISIPLLSDEENNFYLKEVSFHNIKSEMEFLFSKNEHYMKGFIDLVIYHNKKYYLLDWKTNYLGLLKNYEPQNLRKVMEEEDYFMQAAIYSEALQRYIRSMDKEVGDDSFGGVIYLFLRGLTKVPKRGVFHFYPDLTLLQNLKLEKKNYAK
ncbi:MAG: UvrD-helicase domain-containing protein [Chlamydiae bacterium]|nr:UvrD-helicase domain-containing protein [Chlamydiota bacterium]